MAPVLRMPGRRVPQSARHHHHRRSAGRLVGPHCSVGRPVVAALNETVLLQDLPDGRAELRMRETVEQRIENDSRFGQEGRDRSGQGRELETAFLFVDRTELADETDDGVRCPGREAEDGQRQKDHRRPDVRLPPPFAERCRRRAERRFDVTGHDQPGHLPGRADDEPENGRVAVGQDGDGQDESE